MKIIIGLLSFICIISFVSCKKANTEVVTQTPNVVFILADDMGWADLPAYGNPFNEAPNLDKLASEGMRFTNAYAACPVCSPTRASIQSGQYPARVGVIDFIYGHWRPYEKVTVPQNRTQYLPLEITSIGEMMKSAGYATGYFGKWHLGSNEMYLPGNQGYDDANTGQGFYNAKFSPPAKVDSTKRFSEQITDLGEAFIEKNKNQPFFLFLAHYDVHVQLDADKDLIDKYLNKENTSNYPGNAIYAAMVEHLDRSVGRIMNKLKEAGLDENTIVVFFSDNGGLISRYDMRPLLAKSKLDVYTDDNPLRYIASSNAPLRAEKGTVYEGGIREPLIVRWPDKIKAGTTSNAIVSSVDFYPTLMELAGIKSPADQVLDGESLIPALTKNEYNPKRAIFWHYPVYHHDEPAGAVRKGNWKLIQNFVTNDVELYNLKADISESQDLADQYPEKREELKTLLENWQKNVKAEFPVANTDFDEAKRKEWGRHPSR